MGAGRPSKYDRKFIESVDKYLKDNQDDVDVVEESTNEKTGRTRYESKTTVKLPTIEGFALYISVNKTTLYEWEKEHKEFSNALEKIRTEQKARLLNKGLSGEYNSTICKLVLSSNHGMSEKTDINFKGKPIPILVKFIDGKSKDDRNPD